MNKGLTLIELLVVITIIGILSSVLFLGSRSEEEKLALQRSAYQLVQDLREVQEMAMGAGEISCDGGKTYSFGIYFTTASSNYYQFADCDANQTYNAQNDKLLKEIKLEKGVQIQSLSPSSPLNIVFNPPDPTTYINQQSWGVEGMITLSFGSEIKQIKINSAGKIEME